MAAASRPRSTERLIVALDLAEVAQTHDQCLKTLGLAPLSRWPIARGACHDVDDGRRLIDSYHCSRYNTQTGRLTEAMFCEVVGKIRCWLDAT